ncbi:hypothetical protein EON63_14405 [archaeon]|nr:MAG: hypothetical protein EON63_14405 [archaeon]
MWFSSMRHHIICLSTHQLEIKIHTHTYTHIASQTPRSTYCMARSITLSCPLAIPVSCRHRYCHTSTPSCTAIWYRYGARVSSVLLATTTYAPVS